MMIRQSLYSKELDDALGAYIKTIVTEYDNY